MNRLLEPYTTGTGQEILVHPMAACLGEHCTIHNPSDHSMKDFPTHWRDDIGIMERICPCGVGHPDPDQYEFLKERFGEDNAEAMMIHGCCGKCCSRRHIDA